MASVTSGSNYSIDNQISFIVQWFRTWSELQKDDFVNIFAQKLSPGSVNGLVNGMQNVNVGYKRVSLFSCQVKLFNEWWETWSEADKENLTARLRESDSKFWIAVQQEIDGTRRRLEDDFFLTINTGSNSNFTATAPVTVNGNDVNVVPVSASVAMTNGISNEVEDDGNLDMDPPDAE